MYPASGVLRPWCHKGIAGGAQPRRHLEGLGPFLHIHLYFPSDCAVEVCHPHIICQDDLGAVANMNGGRRAQDISHRLDRRRGRI